MRLSAPALLIASSVSAATYTNSFGTSDPAFQIYTESFSGSGMAYDASVPYSGDALAIMKPWDTSATNGSFSVSGWTSLPQAYIDANPTTSGFGAATFQATLLIPGVTTFKISDLTSVSYQITANAGNTSPVLMTLWLLAADGKNYQVHPQNSTYAMTRTGPGGTGDYVFTYTSITLLNQYQNPSYMPFDPDNDYIGLRFSSGFAWDFANSRVARDQFLDVTFQSASITLGGGAPVPEPSTYGLMLGGLALAGAVIRRRKTSK